MSSTLLFVLTGVLLLMATSLVLWQWSSRRAAVQTAQHDLDKRLKLAAEALQGSIGGDLEVELAALRQQANAGERSLPWHNVLLRAGLSATLQMSALIAAPTMGLAVLGWILGGPLLGLLLLAVSTLGTVAWLWHRTSRRRLQMVRQIPSFLDAVIRMLSIGHSVQSAFQSAASTVEAPLSLVLQRASRLQQAGMELDKAYHAMGDIYRLDEMILLASVMRLSLRYGGRADTVIERVATFLRDREQAQRELLALSAETRLSAWVLFLLPLGLAAFIITTNVDYIANMWQDATGKKLLLGALFLQTAGGLLLYKLAKSL